MDESHKSPHTLSRKLNVLALFQAYSYKGILTRQLESVVIDLRYQAELHFTLSQSRPRPPIASLLRFQPKEASQTVVQTDGTSGSLIAKPPQRSSLASRESRANMRTRLRIGVCKRVVKDRNGDSHRARIPHGWRLNTLINQHCYVPPSQVGAWWVGL